MRPLHVLLALSLCPLALPVSAQETTPDAPAGAGKKGAQRPAFKVCFVDLDRAFDGWETRKLREKQLNDDLQTKKKELEKVAQEIKDLAARIKAMRPSEARRRMMKQLMHMEVRYKHDTEWATEEFNARLKRLLTDLYKELLTHVDRFARDGDYDAVFKVAQVELRVGSTSELKLKVQLHNVLYYRKSLDRTDALIKLLNSPKKGAPEGGDRGGAGEPGAGEPSK